MSEAGTLQLTLAFPVRPALGLADFMVTPANAHAAELVLDPAQWPGGRLALVGPAGSGKTHLAHALMADRPADRVDAAALRPAAAEALASASLVIVEDADRLAGLPLAEMRSAEDGLFHLFNLAAAGETKLLVTGREPPVRWPIQSPDLASRLQSLTPAEIAVPDDALLSSLVVKLGRDRGLDIEEPAAAYLASRTERSFAGVARTVALVDTVAALRKRRGVTLALAAAALKEAGTAEKNAEE
ncbi:MAG: chromosomal replication initiator DnaA [Pseudomonadota bacterium]